LDDIFEGLGDAMEGAESQDAAECSLAAPSAGRGDGDGPCNVVFMIIHDETERTVQILIPMNMNAVRGLVEEMLTSSMSSPSPDSPRTSPSGLPIT